MFILSLGKQNRSTNYIGNLPLDFLGCEKMIPLPPMADIDSMKAGMVVHTLKPTRACWGAEAGGSLCSRPAGLNSETMSTQQWVGS